ncbi:MAG TPA: hypothetical protein VI299_25165 [Polyangiales bacterium]
MSNDAQAPALPDGQRSAEAPRAAGAADPRASQPWGRRYARVFDLVLGVLGTAMGWVSLSFPFGRDQGLYYYVAREWVLRDAVPYRDVLDHKTPGIYIVHALAIRLFGATMWGIRVLDMIAVLLTGLVAATFAAPRGERVPAGARGVAILAANLFFYGSLSFWDTSQSELWYGLLGVTSVMAARRFAREPRAQLASGAFAGAALIMKPPAIWFVLIAAVLLVLRVAEHRIAWPKRLLLAGARFAAGAAAVVVPVLGYFGVRGAWPAMVEIVVRSNALYADKERGVQSLSEAFARLGQVRDLFGMIVTVLLVGVACMLVYAVIRRDKALRNRYLLVSALALASVIGLAMQLKFYLLHYVVMVAPAVVISAVLASDLNRLFPPRLRAAAPGATLFALVMLFCWSRAYGSQVWIDENKLTLKYLRGEISREEYARFFALPNLGFWWEDSEKVGLWIKEHSSPEDTIAVRGFEPEIYAVAERRYPGRFFWTTFLVSPTRGTPEMTARWNAEDRATIVRERPRYVVALTGVMNGPDSVGFFLPLGYQVVQVVRNLTLMERIDPAPGG